MDALQPRFRAHPSVSMRVLVAGAGIHELESASAASTVASTPYNPAQTGAQYLTETVCTPVVDGSTPLKSPIKISLPLSPNCVQTYTTKGYEMLGEGEEFQHFVKAMNFPGAGSRDGGGVAKAVRRLDVEGQHEGEDVVVRLLA